MKKILMLCTAAALLLLTTGCFDLTIQYGVRKDGSGEIELQTLMTPKAIAMLSMSGQNTNLKKQLYDEAKLKKTAEKLGEGVTFVESKYIEREDGYKGAWAKYKFDDITKVKLDLQAGMGGAPQGKSAEKAKDLWSFERAADGTLTLKGVKEEEPTSESKPDPNFEQQFMMMKQMMQGMKIRMIVKGLDPIAETTAAHFDKDTNTITLLKMDLDKMMQNEELFKKAMKQELEDPMALQKMGLEGIEVQPPTKDAVIKFK